MMPTRQRLATHIGGVLAPNSQDILGASDIPGGAPQEEQRASDLGGEIGLIVNQIDARSRSVIFTHGVDGRWLTGATYILRHGLGRECLGCILRALEARANEVVGPRPDDALGEIVRLD